MMLISSQTKNSKTSSNQGQSGSSNFKTSKAKQYSPKKNKANSDNQSQAFSSNPFLEDKDLIQLRPQSVKEYIGQTSMIKQLRLILDSAKMRSQMPEHLLFYGQPGLGKTTIAQLISTEMNCNFKVLAAPALQKVGDLVSLLLNLEPKTVLFIDEIHRLKAPLEETLYSAMEDKQVDLLMGKGQGATTARLDIVEFVLVGATTQLGKLSKPLKDRFPSVFQLQPYTEAEMYELISRNCRLLGLNLESDARMFLATRSRGVPRVANNLLKRILDYQIVHGLQTVSQLAVENFLHDMGILDRGLTRADIKYLKAIRHQAVGLKTLSAMLMEESETVELVIEPYLLHLGFVDKSNEGRKITILGNKFLERLE